MKTTIDRLYEWVDFKEDSIYKLSKEIGVSNGYFSKQKQANGAISSNIIEKIVNYYIDLDANWFLTGKGERLKRNINEKQQNNSVDKSVAFSYETKHTEKATLLNESQEVYGTMPKVVTLDGLGKDNIVLVPVKAAAGYLSGYGDAEFIQKLQTFSLPNIKNGTFRMFQVAGHSMYPTISDGSFVVGEWVENWVKDVKDNLIYIIVSNEGILVKRVLNRLKKYENLFLKSDNRREHPNINLGPTEIKEVWAVKMHLTYELPDPSILYDRVGDLEAEIEYIKSTLKAKN